MERVTVEYAVEISVAEDQPAPTCEQIADAIYRLVDEVDSREAVYVTSESGGV
jgi:hypothetical protein